MHIRIAIRRVQFFAMACTKFAVRLSAIGSNIAAVRCILKENIIILIIGIEIIEKTSNNPAAPTAFLINTLLAIIKLKPSERYDPTIGM